MHDPSDEEAKWVFMAVPGEASMGGMFDPNDPEGIQRVRDAGARYDEKQTAAGAAHQKHAAARTG